MGIPEIWDDGFGGWLEAILQQRAKNVDINPGSPLGVGVIQVTPKGNKRVSASTAFLSSSPTNLTIMTGATVEKILFADRKACCVEIHGKKSKCSLTDPYLLLG